MLFQLDCMKCLCFLYLQSSLLLHVICQKQLLFWKSMGKKCPRRLEKIFTMSLNSLNLCNDSCRTIASNSPVLRAITANLQIMFVFFEGILPHSFIIFCRSRSENILLARISIVRNESFPPQAVGESLSRILL